MKKALLLLSGGIDSPVAGELFKNKLELIAIHFSQEPFTDSSPEKKSLKAGKKLGLEELIVVEAGNELQAIADTSYREYYFVLMKIFFMKVSEKIAIKKGINFLITGESLGQVSSQTLSNLQSINSSVKIEILRPLLFLEKQEIIDISKKKELYEISCGKEMCDALASGKPKTKTKKEKVEREMKKCKMNELVKSALKKIRIEKI
jgi:tRNA uracil 4-sulfurtransferase